jgi:hypothetical protein
MHGKKMRVAGWELAAGLLVVVVAGVVAGAAVERLTATTDAVRPVTESRTVVTRGQVHPGRTRKPHRTPPWINAAQLRRRVEGVASRAGAVGVAVRPLADGPPVDAGDLTTGAAWSTIKVPIVLARFRLAESRHESDAGIGALAERAITESDNEAAAALFSEIETAKGGLTAASAYVGDELRAAGDPRTTINTVQPDYGPYSTYGQTQWSLDAGTLFYRQLALRCITPAGAVSKVLALMAQVTPSQRWGIGAAHWPEAGTLRFKGGWGPDRAGRWIVRQFGIIESADSRRGFVVGMIASPGDGTFESGVKALDELAAAVAASTKVGAAPAFVSCR